MSEEWSSQRRPRTIHDLRAMKARGEKISVLTAYDVLSARLLEEAGIDVILVGDSVGQVVAGYDSTLPVTVGEMIYHARAVRRGARETLVVVDLPFLSYQPSVRDGILNGGRVLKETGAQAVKVEGGEEVLDRIRGMVRASIPVMGHLGVTPQSVHLQGGYRIRGWREGEREYLLRNAKLLEETGCFALVLEMVVAEVAREVTEALSIPTIGIGAGPHCDGQVLVLPDMLGVNEGFAPRFLKRYGRLADATRAAVASYVEEVKTGRYPDEEHSVSLEEARAKAAGKEK